MELKDIDEVNENIYEIEQLAEVIYNLDVETMFQKETLIAVKHLASIIQRDTEEIKKIVDKETKQHA